MSPMNPWHDVEIGDAAPETVVPMCIMGARPIGVMRMTDQGEGDDKIIAVHADDPEFSHFNSMDELPTRSPYMKNTRTG